jgi:hypothetical protein
VEVAMISPWESCKSTPSVGSYRALPRAKMLIWNKLASRWAA